MKKEVRENSIEGGEERSRPGQVAEEFQEPRPWRPEDNYVAFNTSDGRDIVADLREELPPLYGLHATLDGRVEARARFFDSYSGTVWYAAEFDGKFFFGIVERKTRELCHFTLPGISSDPRPDILVKQDHNWKTKEVAAPRKIRTRHF